MTNQVYCFGEVLYDILPAGIQAGGAPMNVAIHLQNFGIKSGMISRVGDDDLGKNIVAFMNERGVNTDFVSTDHEYDTGTVPVVFNEKNEPQYTITQPAAWDFIEVTPEIIQKVSQAKALVFGSLACRNKQNLKTLHSIAASGKLLILDVNMRAPFYTKEKIFELMSLTHFVKLNEEEFDRIADWLDIKKDKVKSVGEEILKHFGLKLLIVTKGAAGADVYQGNKLYSATTPKIDKVADTIGCGDSFLAAFIKKYVFDKLTIPEALNFACATGALVATHHGATPRITEKEIWALIND